MADSYRLITTKLRRTDRPNAILVDAPLGSREKEVWIPRSLIHGGDELKLSRAFIGQEVTFRIFEWKAEQLGFPG